jgi:hypothetical protein
VQQLRAADCAEASRKDAIGWLALLFPPPRAVPTSRVGRCERCVVFAAAPHSFVVAEKSEVKVAADRDEHSKRVESEEGDTLPLLASHTVYWSGRRRRNCVCLEVVASSSEID